MSDMNNMTNFAACRCKLAYSTVPLQEAQTIYDYSTASAYGTLFPELNIPQGQYGPDDFIE